MNFVKKQFVLAWEFYKTRLFKWHLGCMIAFLAVCVLSGLVFHAFQNGAMELISAFMESAQESGLVKEDGSIGLLALLGNNLQATVTATVMGVLPFVFLPVLSLVLNGVVVGALAGMSAFLEVALWKMILCGLLPHGLFEIPAIMLGVAMGLYLCACLNAAIRKKPGAPALEHILPQLCRQILCVVLPLLAAAAVIETFVTPLLLQLVL